MTCDRAGCRHSILNHALPPGEDKASHCLLVHCDCPAFQVPSARKVEE